MELVNASDSIDRAYSVLIGEGKAHDIVAVLHACCSKKIHRTNQTNQKTPNERATFFFFGAVFHTPSLGHHHPSLSKIDKIMIKPFKNDLWIQKSYFGNNIDAQKYFWNTSTTKQHPTSEQILCWRA